MGLLSQSPDSFRRGARRERRRFEASVRANNIAGALRHSRQEERNLAGLINREPDERFHRFVLAGLLYNRSTVLDAIGRGEPAIVTARRALEIYDSFDPAQGSNAERPDAAFPADAELVIAHAADARARLAGLLAKYEGRSAADAVHRHGAAAVETYAALQRAGGDTTQEDVNRVQAQYDAAKTYLR